MSPSRNNPAASIARPALTCEQRRSRRAFLRAVGASALSVPFLRSLEFSAVHAQSGTLPMSFVGVYYPHGTSSPLFKRPSGATEDNFSLTFVEPRSGEVSVLAPFEPFKDRVLVIDGIDYLAGAAGHDGPRTALTGSGQNGKGPSIDQYLAVSQGLGDETVFSSLILGVGTNNTDHTDNVSYAQGGASLPKIIDPSETFRVVFANAVAQGDPQQAADIDARRQAGQSVVDFIRWDISRLQDRLGSAEKDKLDQHLASLRDLEKQLGQFEASCQLADQPPTFERTKRYNGGEPNFEQITNLQIDMLAQAIACDLTRFATLWLADLSAGAINGTGINHPDYTTAVDVHNTVAHGYSIDLASGPDVGDPQSWARLAVQNRYSYGKVVRLLEQLELFGMLDSALVMAVTDMGNTAAHSSTDVPVVLAGGANGRMRMGRYVSLQDNCPPNNFWCPETEKVLKPNNQLLVSVAQAFGANTDSFGEPTNPSHANGALPELA